MIVKFLDKFGKLVKSITSIAYLPVDTEPVEDSKHLITSGAVDAVTESLQEQVDDIAGKAGSGYTPKGEASVATLNALSCRVYTYTKTLSPTYTELTSIATTTMADIHEIEIEFKEPNNSHNYKLVCNMFFGQSRFIDMGYGY